MRTMTLGLLVALAVGMPTALAGHLDPVAAVRSYELGVGNGHTSITFGCGFFLGFSEACNTLADDGNLNIASALFSAARADVPDDADSVRFAIDDDQWGEDVLAQVWIDLGFGEPTIRVGYFHGASDVILLPHGWEGVHVDLCGKPLGPTPLPVPADPAPAAGLSCFSQIVAPATTGRVTATFG